MHKISCYGGIKLKYLSNLNFYLFYNDYETSYTPLILIMLVGTEICVSGGLRVGGDQSTLR